MICQYCGKQINGQPKFCPKCGAAIASDTSQNSNENNIVSYPSSDERTVVQTVYNNERSYKLSVLKRILSIVICIFIVIITIVSSLVCAIRVGMDKERLQKIVAGEDIREVKIDDEYLSDFIISNVSENIISKFNISAAQVEDIISSEQVSRIISGLVEDYTAMFVFGEAPNSLNETAIINEIKDLGGLIYAKTGYRFTEKDYADIQAELSGGNLSFLIEENIKDSIGIDPYSISMLFSIPAVCIFIALDIGLLVLQFKINNWKIKSSFAFLGVSWMVSGVINISIALFMIIFSGVNHIFLVSAVIKSLSVTVIIVGSVLLIVGILLFIIQNKFLKNK